MRRYLVALLLILALALAACAQQPAAVEEPAPAEEEAPVEEEAPAEEEPAAEEPAAEEPAEEEAAEEPAEEEEAAEEPAEEEAAVGALELPAEFGALAMENDLLVLDNEGCPEDYTGYFERIEAVDPTTVVFTMCKPDPAFRAKVAHQSFGIQPAEHLLEAGQAGALLENPVGSGPYQLDTWNRGESVILSAFEDYWGNQPMDPQMVFRWATEGAARLLELQTGNVDQIAFVGPEDFETVENDPNLQLIPNPNPNIFYLAMTNTFEPFDDPRVRQAIAMGIDRQRIIDNFFPEGSEVPDYFTPCTIPNGCEGEPWYEFDPEAARALLEEAGYGDGFETSIFYRDVYRVYLPEPPIVATEIQTQLEENLGITAEVVPMESGPFLEEASAGRLDGFYLLGWGADYPHPTNFLDYHFGEANMQFGEPHPEIYEPLREAATIADSEEAAPLYEQANNAIRELVPMVPMAHGAAADAALAAAENSHVRPFGAILGHIVDTPDDTFVYMQSAEPISLYCGDETDGETFRVCSQIVETLLAYGLETGDTEPALATGCEPNEESTEWTCTLREDVTFHDGSTLDANDVVMSYAIGVDASNPLHAPVEQGGAGSSGAFEYYSYLWGLMNAPEEEAAE
ncbi:MAG: ABC transporter substrate-binding protein [Chloroflexota bacterium]|nr:ABC transporter substrate-binding protein [Chloroflexota bacterium]